MEIDLGPAARQFRDERRGWLEANRPEEPIGVEVAVMNGEVVITGQKVWTSGATTANIMFCLCRTDPDAPKHRGISFVLTPMFRDDGEANGFELAPIRQITGEASFTQTFMGGTAQVQRNIVGERVLGLPKEPAGASEANQ